MVCFGFFFKAITLLYLEKQGEFASTDTNKAPSDDIGVDLGRDCWDSTLTTFMIVKMSIPRFGFLLEGKTD